MVYYVAYSASGELRYRSRIPRRLRALGCRSIRRSFWEVDEGNIGLVARMLQGSSPVILKRTRDVRKPTHTKGEKQSSPGSLIVIAYEVPKEEEKRKIVNLLRRAPCIRLCRGVYAFSQLHGRLDRSHELADARTFWKFIREIDENATVIPRLTTAGHRSVGRLLEVATKRVEKEIDKVVEGYRILLEKVDGGEIDRRQAVGTARKLMRRFKIAKKVAVFYERWLGINVSTMLVKPYPTIRKVRSLLHEKYGIVAKGWQS